MKYTVMLHMANRSWNEDGIEADEVLALKKIYGDSLAYYAMSTQKVATKVMLPKEAVPKEIAYLTEELARYENLVKQYGTVLERLKEYKIHLDNIG